MTATNHTSKQAIITPSTTKARRPQAQASLYQQLRARLAVLRLHDAAEHLPAVLTPPPPKA